LDGGSAGRTFIFEQDAISVKGGVLEFPYTFKNSGLHEVFFDFAFASNPQKIHEAPDFLMDIQKPEIPEKDGAPVLVGIVSALIGGMVGWAMRSCKTSGVKIT
jgi:hypothetical protein